MADLPAAVGAAAELALAGRGDREGMIRTIDQSVMPMLMVDDERRYVEVNAPARLLFRRSLAEMRQLRIEDLIAADELPSLEARWTQLLTAGCVAGFRELGFPDGSSLEIVFLTIANVAPGLHLSVIAPADWPEDELESAHHAGGPPTELTSRELEILELAAGGLSGPAIADRLVVAPSTVKTHFANVYEKLGVTDRVAAVARAMRLGLID
jgi:DNA-binding CsgD family transcriptional regulator